MWTGKPFRPFGEMRTAAIAEASWRQLAGSLAWLTAVSFVVAAVLFVLLALEIITPPPAFAPDADFPRRIIAVNESRQATWLVDLTSSLLYAVGSWSSASSSPGRSA